MSSRPVSSTCRRSSASLARSTAKPSPPRRWRRSPAGVTTILATPNTSPAVDDPAVVDFVLRRARATGLARVLPMAALTKGREGREIAEIGLLAQAGAAAFFDGPRAVANSHGDAPRADLRARFWRAGRAFSAGPRSGRRRRHERGRDRDPARPFRRSRRGGDHRARPRFAARRADRRALSRGHRGGALSLDALRRAKARGPADHLRNLDQPSDAQRGRYRRLSQLFETASAVARRGRQASCWSRRWPRG